MSAVQFLVLLAAILSTGNRGESDADMARFFLAVTLAIAASVVWVTGWAPV